MLIDTLLLIFKCNIIIAKKNNNNNIPMNINVHGFLIFSFTVYQIYCKYF